jgi:hypothetical protein
MDVVRSVKHGLFYGLAIVIDVPKRIVSRIRIHVPTLRIRDVLIGERLIRTREPPLRRREVPRPEEIEAGFPCSGTVRKG